MWTSKLIDAENLDGSPSNNGKINKNEMVDMHLASMYYFDEVGAEWGNYTQNQLDSIFDAIGSIYPDPDWKDASFLDFKMAFEAVHLIEDGLTCPTKPLV